MALKRQIIFLSEEQIAALKALAQGRKIQELVRAAVSEYIARHEGEKRS